jgi:hypothetical protein
MIGSIFSHHEILKKHFVIPLKSNRKVALSRTDKRQGKYQTVETLVFKKDKTVRGIYLEGVDFPLLPAKQVFVNEDGSIGVLYLVTSDTTLTYERMTTLYRTRWHVEEYHKSLKQMNHSALKLSIYMQALMTAYEQLKSLQPIRFSKKCSLRNISS